MTYIEWLEDKCLHILDESWVCDLMSEYAGEWEYCQKHCENGKGECLRRLYTLLHKTEPSSSEIPNNCETCKHNKLEWYSEVCDGCSKAHSNYEPKTEPLDKDTNVRSKAVYDKWGNVFDARADIEDEPQTWTKENCKGCKYNEYPYDSGTCFVRVCINGNKYEPKTEPQIIACPIQEEDADYARWLYEDEPQTDIEIARAIVHKAIDNAVLAEDAYPDLRQKMHDAVDNYEPQTERSE